MKTHREIQEKYELTISFPLADVHFYYSLEEETFYAIWGEIIQEEAPAPTLTFLQDQILIRWGPESLRPPLVLAGGAVDKEFFQDVVLLLQEYRVTILEQKVEIENAAA